jgi:hypothetical protein
MRVTRQLTTLSLQLGFQAEADRFFIFLAAMLMVTFAAASLAIALSASSPNLDTAMGSFNSWPV